MFAPDPTAGPVPVHGGFSAGSRVQTTVLQLETPLHGTVIVKAGGPADHHLRRELRAHREWLGPWVRAWQAGHGAGFSAPTGSKTARSRH